LSLGGKASKESILELSVTDSPAEAHISDDSETPNPP
jgi:hypothetical protein